MTHHTHDPHPHSHSEHCYLHDGHLHAAHEDHYAAHVLAVSAENPDGCVPVTCAYDHVDCGHPQVPYGDHVDYPVNGRLHRRHGDHCDDHGSVTIL